MKYLPAPSEQWTVRNVAATTPNGGRSGPVCTDSYPLLIPTPSRPAPKTRLRGTQADIQAAPPRRCAWRRRQVCGTPKFDQTGIRSHLQRRRKRRHGRIERYPPPTPRHLCFAHPSRRSAVPDRTSWAVPAPTIGCSRCGRRQLRAQSCAHSSPGALDATAMASATPRPRRLPALDERFVTNQRSVAGW